MIKLPPLPVLKDPAVTAYLRDLSLALQSEFDKRVPSNQGVNEALLVSPSKKIYSVRVDDAGVLSTTLVLG